MNIKNHLTPKFYRRIFAAVGIYVTLTCLYFFIDAFFIKIFSNDQCVWVKEKVDGKDVLAIRTILKGGVTDRAGILDGDILLAINDSTIRNDQQAQRILNMFTPQDTVYYTISRQGEIMKMPLQIVKSYNPVYLSLAMLGFGFLFIGWIVGHTRPGDWIPRLFFKMSTTAALMFVIIGTVFGPGYQGNLFWLINAIIGFSLFPAYFIHFFLWFPREKLTMKKRRWVVPSIYAFSFLNTVLLFFLNNGGVAISIMFSMMGIGFGVFCHSYFNLKDSKERKPFKSILIGTAIGFTGFIYLFLIPFYFQAIFINYPEFLFPVLIVVLIPLSFGYSIFRYRTMDTELIIKQSLVYASATASLALTYLVILFLAGYVIQNWTGYGANSPVLQFGILLIIAFVFAPVKERIQEVVDKRFFRERYNYQKALLRFSQDLPGLTQLDQILQKVIYTVIDTMHIESMAITLYVAENEQPVNYVQRGITKGHCEILNRKNGLIGILSRTQKAQSLYTVALSELNIPDDEKNMIREANIVLAVPMFKKEKLVGVLFMGPKLSEKPFSQEDTDLLTTLANQAGIAIENARLLKEELEKAKLENELNVGRRIQQSLLPSKSPDIPNLDIAGVSIPALSVGGDYFDYIPLDDGRLLIAVGDVSGKGVSAALYMSKIQGMIQIASRLYSSPRQILIEVNKWMYHGMERQSFVTIILALVDTYKKTITICRAGHNPVIALHHGKLKLIQCKGLGVGLVTGEKFEDNLDEQVEKLDEDNAFIFYTDGITEAMNTQQEEFGDDKLYDMVQTNTNLSSQDLLNKIVSEVGAFCRNAEQHDDITLVIVKVRPK
ncbi:SpoIIE family protein phosphatase [bacterium]|nr:SpoIIE family protein phosphatase [bacterium]